MSLICSMHMHFHAYHLTFFVKTWLVIRSQTHGNYCLFFSHLQLSTSHSVDKLHLKVVVHGDCDTISDGFKEYKSSRSL